MCKIAVLMTVHNRKAETLLCLASLHRAILQVPARASFDVFMTDDGSTDGTAEAVIAAYPDIHIIKGNGNLFWNRGMIAAWTAALSHAEYDAFIWLNNDVELYPTALSTLLDAAAQSDNNAVIVGAFRSAATGKPSYGGLLHNRMVAPDGNLQNVTEMNGNFVYVSSKIVKQIGILDPLWHHSNGDFDFGYRAGNAGFKLLLTPIYVGLCERNADHKWRNPKIRIAERFRTLYSPLGPPPTETFRFNLRHFSLWRAMWVFVYTNLVAVWPGVRFLISAFPAI